MYVNGEKDVKFFYVYICLLNHFDSDNIFGMILDLIIGVYINWVFKWYLILVLFRKEIIGKKFFLFIISNLFVDIYKGVIRCID